MPVEHHDLIHELPEFKEQIHQLKMEDDRFRKMFDEYHDLTRAVENMENEVLPASTATEEQAKLRRLQLKDEMYTMLKAAAEPA
ncbi:YdcH family protein [Oceanospirillum sediminis]|uniref:DUF465 domain-containing protein n=1 Tax=Oceanospirillum sediminis TaxID=2760088 RepID=A0A839IKV6_9GAMM|nr:DUF465 domain-containing protein [Oceanospirillum sediminis]MBB1485340.1 DUF465 domain-containing protein [Oceanospirillum sediminis]